MSVIIISEVAFACSIIAIGENGMYSLFYVIHNGDISVITITMGVCPSYGWHRSSACSHVSACCLIALMSVIIIIMFVGEVVCAACSHVLHMGDVSYIWPAYICSPPSK